MVRLVVLHRYLWVSFLFSVFCIVFVQCIIKYFTVLINVLTCFVNFQLFIYESVFYVATIKLISEFCNSIQRGI